MKLILKIISIVIIILTLSEQLASQGTTNSTTPTNTNTTNPNSTTNTTINNTKPIEPPQPIKIETDPYKLYICDEKNSSSISIVKHTILYYFQELLIKIFYYFDCINKFYFN